MDDRWTDGCCVSAGQPGLDSVNGPLRGGDKDGMGSEELPRVKDMPRKCRHADEGYYCGGI